MKLTTTSGWRHIKTQTGTNASSIDFLHGYNGVIFDNTYDVYEFVVHYMYSASGHELRIEPSQDGSTFTLSNTVGYALGAYRNGGTQAPILIFIMNKLTVLDFLDKILVLVILH